ncbi:AcrR family transcriptional regulator [Bacillus ectoiniformans]|uniref:TetR/AcrR family transcriptional regulator n=1 Tax=Bacillus ectoiniformans TaxID=1494429 RepID=UPI00195B8650|nr:TetR/AcrR family transcriptional regulator [Bacillus ectoiniformans]MBM7647879.1 AcrR family transcriptional regulator [Bacillus ectoiniformans]
MDGFQKRTEAKKKLIKTAAFSLLQTSEAKSIKVSDIAKEAGVSQVSIYNYFANKDNLIREVMKDYLNDQVKQTKAVFEGEWPLKEKIEFMVFQKKSSFQEIPPSVFQSLLLEDEELKQHTDQLYINEVLPFFTKMIQKAQEKKEINPHVSISSILFYLGAFKEAGEKLQYGQLSLAETEQLTEELVQLFFYGLAVPPTSE